MKMHSHRQSLGFVSAAPPQMSGPAGWYRDPWNQEGWRWWDGRTWTAHVGLQSRKPALPGWLSVPVILAALLVIPAVLLMAAKAPLAFALAVSPLVVVLPVMLWLDRVEPEPRSALVHALLWGATVAGLVAGSVNSFVASLGGQLASAVVSAPVVEEAMKLGGILYAVRRREIDSPMDGVVYAGWTAVGFAAVEDVQYFAKAAQEGNLAGVFVLRGILSPFAHPLFTAWSGLAIGGAVAKGRSAVSGILWGYPLAVLCHALWNGSASAPALLGDAGMGVFGLTVIAFVVLFFAFAITLFRVRRKAERRFVELVPWLAQRYGMQPSEVLPFGNFRSMLALRKRLAGPQRRWFDRMHAALARLAVLHDRRGGADPATEQVLVQQLTRARTGVEES